MFGALSRGRTCNLPLRRGTRYPVVPPGQNQLNNTMLFFEFNSKFSSIFNIMDKIHITIDKG